MQHYDNSPDTALFVILALYTLFCMTVGACACAIWAGIKGGEFWGTPGALGGIFGGGAVGAPLGIVLGYAIAVAVIVILYVALMVLMIVAMIAALLAPPACVCCCCGK